MKKPTKVSLLAILLIVVVTGAYFISRSGRNPCTERIHYTSITSNEGIDLDSLFVPPSAKELQNTLQDWQNRPVHAKAVELIKTFKFASGHTVQIIRHEVGQKKHYGALFLPQHFQKAPPASLPVVIFAFGLDQHNPEVSIYHNVVQQLMAGLDSNCILVLPSYRGQSLRLRNQYFCSDGFFGDAFDGAADDALALLNVCLDQVPAANPDRIAVMGASRGGTVALLCGIRDPRIQLVIDLAGPTNFLDIKAYQRHNLQFKYQFLNKKGSVPELRKRILASSPLYFSEYLPDLYLVHGVKDKVVPIDQARQLVERIKTTGDTSKVRLQILPNTGHELRSMALYINRINDWVNSQ